jgi:hypothetical protein
MGHLSSELFLKRLSELWQLNERQHATLAGLGEQAIPALQDIVQTLEQMFAHTPQLAELWPTTANKAFANRSPIQVIEEEGLSGLEQVRRFLCLHH